MRSRSVMVLCTIFAIALVTGCGSQSTTASLNVTPAHNQPVTIQVVLTDIEHITIYSTHTIHNAQAAHNLYQAALALPKSPFYPSCPLDQGYRYRLTFFQSNGAIWHTLMASPTGCHYVFISQKDIRWASDAFWTVLAHTLGESEKDMFVYLTPTP